MRGRSTTWTRVRVNLSHVPEAERPPQEALDPDYDPWVEWAGPDRSGSSSGRGAPSRPGPGSGGSAQRGSLTRVLPSSTLSR